MNGIGIGFRAFFVPSVAIVLWAAAAEPPAAAPPQFRYDPAAEGWRTPGPAWDLHALLRRYAADSRTLDQYFDTRLSHERKVALDAFANTWLGLLEQVPFASLDVEGRIDYLLLRAVLRRGLREREDARRREAGTASLVPFMDAILRLDDDLRRLAFAEPAQAASRVDAIASGITKQSAEIGAGRLSASPQVGRRAARIVRDLQIALKRWFDFHNGYDPVFTWWVAAPWKRADAALSAYSVLLDEKIGGVQAADKETIVGDPVGREAIEQALTEEFIPYTPEELIDAARKEFDWCRAEMLASARQIGYGDDWKKALEHVKDDYVRPGQQPALIRDLAVESIEFARRGNLITIPEAAVRTWRMEMMSPERQRINPFFTGGSVISVSYPTQAMPEQQKLMSMRGNNIHFARATVFHELIPGHYLQQYSTERYRPWRSVFRTPFWEEGWAFYWEMLFWDAGFPRSPENRIGMLFWRMHRAARVMFSLSFHLGRMTAPEAIDFLVNEVGHERENAAAEVRRSFETDEYGPLYQAAYEVGAMQFRALHHALVDSGKMTNPQFHDAVLKLNSIPVEMVRASLLGQKLPKDFSARWRFYNEVPPAKHGQDPPANEKHN